MRTLYVSRALALCLAAVTLSSLAQEPTTPKVPIVGVLMLMAGPHENLVPALREGLRQFGYVDGTNVRIERRDAQNHLDRLPKAASELISLGADLIVVGGEPQARAAKQASSAIPIVLVAFDHDPVASGLIDSFSRPGGNVTGIFTRQSELVGKRLELLKEVLPKASKVAVFWDALSVRQLGELEPAAHALGIDLARIELSGSYDYVAAFENARHRRADAVILLFSPRFSNERVRIATLALEQRMPTIYQEESAVEAGGSCPTGHPP